MWRKLKKSGEPEPVRSDITLIEQQKCLKISLMSLEEERNEIMGHFRYAKVAEFCFYHVFFLQIYD